MVRQIIHIDEDKCTGCGICANACHEGAIDIIDGKAKLVREHFCDGFGDCLPGCPTGAITFEEREAPAYDEAAVKAAQDSKTQEGKAPETKAPETKTQKPQVQETQVPETKSQENKCQEGNCQNNKVLETTAPAKKPHQCPGSMMRQMKRDQSAPAFGLLNNAPAPVKPVSELQNWPVQIKLAPIQAPYFNGAKLLIAADCTAFSYASFHQDFIRGKVTLVGCPKLDAIDYSKKLTEIIANNDIKNVTIVRMEVPCCGGLEMAAKRALQASGKFIPWQVVTISIDGKILD